MCICALLIYVISTAGMTKGKLGGIINVCSQCSYTTRHMSHFKRHLMVHSGKRPFSCEICSKSFRQKEHLKAHQLTHMAQCEVCYHTFPDKEELRNHITAEHFIN